MFDYSKLRGRITEKYGTVSSLSSDSGISCASLSNKLSNKTAFSQLDIIQLCDLLGIVPGEISDYFFTLKVQ